MNFSNMLMKEETVLFYKMVDWEKRLKKERDSFKEILDKYEPSNSKILDLGCGVGHHLIEFAKWGFQGLGIDSSEESIDEAIERTKEAGLSQKLDFSVGDMRDLSKFADIGKYDLIMCIGNSFALFTLDERSEIIKQSIGMLKPGGQILIQVVNYLKFDDKSEWTINPKIFRNKEGQLHFFVRILEWENEDKDKIKMYVQSLVQKKEDSDEFAQNQRIADFFVVRKSDFLQFENNTNLEINYYGEYNKSPYQEKESNDLIIIVKKI